MRQIWVDADACSREARNIVLRLTKRLSVSVILVANHPLQIRENDKIRVILCGSEKDAADRYIHAESRPKDIAVCRDVELITLLLSKGLFVLNDRGKIYTPETIRYTQMRAKSAQFVHTELGFTKSHSRKKGQSYSHAFARSLEQLLYQTR